jgi:DNA (cytosine-5)-methyltransferase 1
MENVSGMIKGKMKGKFIEIMNTLKSLNYNVKCKLMNAKYYNVPQSRERLIFIGVRKNLGGGIEPGFPKGNKNKLNAFDLIKNIKPDNFIIPNGETLKLLQKTKPGESLSKYHSNGYYNSFFRIPLKGVCRTFSKAGNSGYPPVFHPKENRSLAINEMKILCSFPIDFNLTNNIRVTKDRLGNAVMPKFMQAIAEYIRINILDRI